MVNLKSKINFTSEQLLKINKFKYTSDAMYTASKRVMTVEKNFTLKSYFVT